MNEKLWILFSDLWPVFCVFVVIAVSIYFFLRSDTNRYLHTHKHIGNQPYFLDEGRSVRIGRNKKFETDIDETIVSEDFGYKDIILTSPVALILYFPRRKK